MNLMQNYYQKLQKNMEHVINNESESITKAATLMSTCIQTENKVYFFGTGHSYIVGQEVFARAGGYAGFIPILENELGMNHAFKSTLIERTTEYAEVLLELRLFELADVVLDNRSVYGDASLSHNDEIKTGPTSTIMSCFIVQLLVSAFVQLEVEKGGDVPVFRSSNIDGGDAYNEKLFDRYR